MEEKEKEKRKKLLLSRGASHNERVFFRAGDEKGPTSFDSLLWRRRRVDDDRFFHGSREERKVFIAKRDDGRDCFDSRALLLCGRPLSRGGRSARLLDGTNNGRASGMTRQERGEDCLLWPSSSSSLKRENVEESWQASVQRDWREKRLLSRTRGSLLFAQEREDQKLLLLLLLLGGRFGSFELLSQERRHRRSMPRPSLVISARPFCCVWRLIIDHRSGQWSAIPPRAPGSEWWTALLYVCRHKHQPRSTDADVNEPFLSFAARALREVLCVCNIGRFQFIF